MLFKILYLKAINVSWLVLVNATFILILLSTYFLPIIEPETFSNYLDALWFTMTTILTVGYGDISPVTVQGKIYTIFVLYVIGIALFAAFIGKAFDSLSLYRKRRERGELMYEGNSHIVIIDWSHKAENAIREILRKDHKVEIVIIDKLEKAKEIHERIHYIRGNATDENTLHKANISSAKAVIIFADDKIQDQLLTDGKSLLIATAVERLAPAVFTTVEVEREEHLPNFSHVKVDKFILSDHTIARLAVDAVLKD